jgi:hypothetical protein
VPEPSKGALLFLHVPKAGGTALAGAMSTRFGADESVDTYYAYDPDDEELNAARFVTGHVSMSILERFERPPYTVTMLRDPIERALSMYSYLRELDEPTEPRPRLEVHDRSVRLARQHSLDEFIAVAPELAEFYLGSWQARMLSGSRLDGRDGTLAEAIAGLGRCDFVGLAERPEESADWLSHRLGWAPLTPLPRVNVTQRRVRREDVSPAAMEALLELTSLDRELYREAVRLFEERGSEWEAAPEKDPIAAIEDAPLVGDLTFGDPIRGSGWLPPERVGDEPPVRWMGSTASARVELAPGRAARSVEVEIRHAADPGLLETLRISVNGEAVPHSLAESGPAVIASAPLERRLWRRRTVQLELAVDHAVRPCDIDPRSDDVRELAIAVRRIAVSRRAVPAAAPG